ncbi:DUF3261 domain-containing protein [Aliikangiella sp. IMCC44359]|uniref:DUF3261 domain-containing protein n=1 Tax=Aliikangiella sp. IMCC44359 TaxID=3459125 RepID=UPI00403B2C1D
MQKLIVFSIILFLFTGCAHLQYSDKLIELDNGVQFQLLSPKSFGHNIVATQAAEVSFNNETHELIFQSEITDEKFVVVGLLPAGTRLFTVVYDGDTIEVDGVSQVIKKINPRYLLADIQFALWPVEQVKNSLYNNANCFKSDECRLVNSDSSFLRTLYRGSKKLIEVKYGGVPHYQNHLAFYHYTRGYQLMITPLDIEIF